MTIFFNDKVLHLSSAKHYENTPMKYTVISHGCKNNNFQMKNCDFFLIFAVNIDRGYNEAVLTCTYNICFRAKIRKISQCFI